MLAITSLGNGLRLCVERTRGSRISTVLLMINRGAKDESLGDNGISHFLEHLAFHPPGADSQKLLAALEARGARYNGETTREWTAFHVMCLPEDVPLVMQTLRRLVAEVAPTQETVTRERSVILNEYNLHIRSPWLVTDLFSQALWGQRSLGLTILGSPEIIQRVGLAEFLDVAGRYYRPDNCALVAIGDLDPEAMYAEAEKAFSCWPPAERTNPPYVVQEEPSIVFHREANAAQALLCVGVPGLPYDHPQQAAVDVLGTLLGEGPDSRLFRALREERGLAYQVNVYCTHYRQAGGLGIVCTVPTEHVLEAVRVIVGEFERAAAGAFLDAELESAKARLRIRHCIEQDSGLERARLIARAALFGGGYSLNEVLLNVARLHREEVAAVASQLLRRQNYSFAGIGSFDVEAVAALL